MEGIQISLLVGDHGPRILCFEDGDNIRLQKEGMFVNEYAAWNVFETSTNYPTIFE